MFCSRKLTAKVAISIVAGDAPRSGRRPPAPAQGERDDDGEAGGDRDDPWRAAQHRERVAAGGDQLAVGEVDESHHAEHEADPDADDGVHRAEPDSVDQ